MTELLYLALDCPPLSLGAGLAVYCLGSSVARRWREWRRRVLGRRQLKIMLALDARMGFYPSDVDDGYPHDAPTGIVSPVYCTLTWGHK